MMKKARVVVVFVSGNERALSEMILAAYLIGLKHPKVVLSVQNIPENAVIDGEKVNYYFRQVYNEITLFMKPLVFYVVDGNGCKRLQQGQTIPGGHGKKSWCACIWFT